MIQMTQEEIRKRLRIVAPTEATIHPIQFTELEFRDFTFKYTIQDDKDIVYHFVSKKGKLREDFITLIEDVFEEVTARVNEIEYDFPEPEEVGCYMMVLRAAGFAKSKHSIPIMTDRLTDHLTKAFPQS